MPADDGLYSIIRLRKGSKVILFIHTQEYVWPCNLFTSMINGHTVQNGPKENGTNKQRGLLYLYHTQTGQRVSLIIVRGIIHAVSLYKQTDIIVVYPTRWLACSMMILLHEKGYYNIVNWIVPVRYTRRRLLKEHNSYSGQKLKMYSFSP